MLPGHDDRDIQLTQTNKENNMSQTLLDSLKNEVRSAVAAGHQVDAVCDDVAAAHKLSKVDSLQLRFSFL